MTSPSLCLDSSDLRNKSKTTKKTPPPKSNPRDSGWMYNFPSMHCSFLLWRTHFTMKRNTMSTKPFEKWNCCFYFPIILNNCTRPPPPARLKGLGLIWFNLGFNQTYNHTSTNVGEMQWIVVQQTNHQRGRISFHSWLLGNDDALGW